MNKNRLPHKPGCNCFYCSQRRRNDSRFDNVGVHNVETSHHPFGIIKVNGEKFINKEYALLKFSQTIFKNKKEHQLVYDFITQTLFYGEADEHK